MRLRKAGVPADAIRTVGYDLQQEFDFVNNKRVSRGYVARNSIEVRVDDVYRVGELLELSVGQGATTVGGLRFDLKERAQARTRRAAPGRGRRAREGRGRGGRRGPGDRPRDQGGGGRRLDPRRCRCSGPRPSRRVRPTRVPISTGQIEIRAVATVTTLLQVGSGTGCSQPTTPVPVESSPGATR